MLSLIAVIIFTTSFASSLANDDLELKNINKNTQTYGFQNSLSFGTTAELSLSSLSNPLKLNEEAQLTFTIGVMPEYNKAINNLSAEIVLPEGFVHVSGDLTWQGDLNPGQPIQITSTIKSVKTGDWSIGGSIKGAFDYLYVTVSEDDATISREPFEVPRSDPPFPTGSLNRTEVRELVP